ncbi:MAG: L-aspartate oxidase [Acidobacteria bacterium]|nr:MAG: L-aspartate oxidase [Acidobacteriota bacterium]REJ99055.1 MAG: L-aspartate oxidase [Acidobacteriota bacterium]REK16224.1 MAG: L-aspartate oxidase [Acidobacteriota bacterium]REK43905.1 MAG: L-aspartate oxidase [Acidobacteriota bacterium]
MAQQTDFIVIGSGIAGLRASIALASAGSQVTVLTKAKASDSNTEWAQGGVAVVLSDDDNAELHEDDTLEAGAGLCDEQAVETLVTEGTKYILELIDWGTEFDREGGKLVFTQEAAHSRRRILHAGGDSTGKEIVRALIARARQETTINLLPFADTEKLLINDRRCVGVRYADPILKSPRDIFAKAVVLCTGGAGQLYLHSTNPPGATGDGIAMAYFAGAEIADMEFVQFHPTALSVKNAPRFLLSEAMRGEGGVLRNAHGERFMSKYDDRLEMAPRDIVSRSIVREMRRTGTRNVYLDMTSKTEEFLVSRFPAISKTCAYYGLDISKDMLPVSPASHYCMGGVRTDLWGRTTIPGLYAAGEVTCTGVHGANRLASNSLLEGLVFGARAGEAAASDSLNIQVEESSDETSSYGSLSAKVSTAVRKRVKRGMWEWVGIMRDEESLSRAYAEFRQISRAKLSNASRNFVTNALLVARAALWRKESRGGHFRSDYPERSDELRVHSIQEGDKEIDSAPRISF